MMYNDHDCRRFQEPLYSVDMWYRRYAYCPRSFLNWALFFFTMLLTMAFYAGWADGGEFSLLGTSFFLPRVFLVPLVIDPYPIREASGSAR